MPPWRTGSPGRKSTRRTKGPGAIWYRRAAEYLQGMSFQPSGAIVAAATTSLPEGVGGERNWDYRYSWVRDASFTTKALLVAACPDEASDGSVEEFGVVMPTWKRTNKSSRNPSPP
jgi:alpha,alpha-trehalase